MRLPSYMVTESMEVTPSLTEHEHAVLTFRVHVRWWHPGAWLMALRALRALWRTL